MNLLSIAFSLWLIQQVNDVVNAFLNRKNVPKLFWISAVASFASGAFLFAYLYTFEKDVTEAIVFIVKSLIAVGG